MNYYLGKDEVDYSYLKLEIIIWRVCEYVSVWARVGEHDPFKKNIPLTHGT
jgi:hypothetical protein